MTAGELTADHLGQWITFKQSSSRRQVGLRLGAIHHETYRGRRRTYVSDNNGNSAVTDIATPVELTVET